MPSDKSTDKQPGENWMNRATNRRRTHSGRRPSTVERRREELMQDWYGDLAGPEIGAHMSKAQPLGNFVDQAMGRFGLKDAMALDDLRAGWAELVGADVAQQAQPVALQRKTLIVEVKSAAWRYILESEQKGRLERLVREASNGSVNYLRLVPPGRYAPPG